jgi:hypothetical protein
MEIHQKIYEKLDYFLETKKIPNIIFHGAFGSGKKTIVYNFLYKIYNNDKAQLKNNVIIVNCSHGKGIKFIREDIKFFAKTNIHTNNGSLFKTIVLLNADSLTNDAQSALRRCIELFSFNTRFIIVVENKYKLLNPILSRFCEIFVPDTFINGKYVNLHKYNLDTKFAMNKSDDMIGDLFFAKEITECIQKKENLTLNYCDLKALSLKIYEKGYSCLDLINYIDGYDYLEEDDVKKSQIMLCFYKIKSEFRCEKLLLLFVLDLLFLRLDVDLKNISFM